jgi:hypothetical protein
MSPQVIGIVHEYLCHSSLSPYLERGPKQQVECKVPCKMKWPPFPTKVCDSCGFLDFTRQQVYKVGHNGWDENHLKCMAWYAWGKLWCVANYPENHYNDFNAMDLEWERKKECERKKREKEEGEKANDSG